jgi:thymidine kinase
MLFDDEPGVFQAVMDVRKQMPVLVSGCAATSELDPFGASLPRLIAVADEVHFCRADCDSCGTLGVATRSICLTGKNGQVLVGGEETYRPVCPTCWSKWNGRMDVSTAATRRGVGSRQG